MLRGVTDLFVNGAEAFADEHVAVFDDVIGRLIEKADRPALTELSGRLAPIDNAPANVIDRLARHEDIAIAGPILQKSNVVTDQTLAEVAGAKGEKHLAAIAGRPLISEAVTDVLVGRCTRRDRPQDDRQQGRQPFRSRLRQIDQSGQERQSSGDGHRKQNRPAARACSRFSS